MRKCHSAERKFLPDPLTQRFREAPGISAHKDDLPRPAVAKFAKPLGKGIRIDGSAPGIEQDGQRSTVGIEFLKRSIGVPHLDDLQWAGMPDAVHVIVDDGAHLGATRFADHQQFEAHKRILRPGVLSFEQEGGNSTCCGSSAPGRWAWGWCSSRSRTRWPPTTPSSCWATA